MRLPGVWLAKSFLNMFSFSRASPKARRILDILLMIVGGGGDGGGGGGERVDGERVEWW